MRLADLFQESSPKILDALLAARGHTSTIAWLAAACDLDRRTVKRCLTHLQRLRVVSVDRRFSAGAIVTLAASEAARALVAFRNAIAILPAAQQDPEEKA